MADEITLSAVLTLANGTLQYHFRPGRISIDQTEKTLVSNVIDLDSNNAELLALGDVNNHGYMVLQNLGTETIEIETLNIYSGQVPGIMLLKGGEFSIFRKHPIQDYYAKAAASTSLYYALLGD